MRMSLFLGLVVFLMLGCRGPAGHGGPAGPKGDAGPVGETGPAGQDGTLITVVKFCTDTATYPSTFPEYGLCIDSKLYAVYSTNGGFLAYIPNGSYSSNAVGSSCTFTVNGCDVTR